jgi:hypothetical protein
MKNTKICISLVVISCMLLTSLIVGGAESEYGSEGVISNVAPLIDDSSFFLSDTTVYTGESVESAVDVSDDNGATDVLLVTVVLSDDDSVSDDDISIQLDKNADVDAATSTFGKVWTAEGEMGPKNILITAKDSGGLSASNNGVQVGTIELNPMIGFEVKDGTGSGLTTISFPASPPGTVDVPSNQNSIQITNVGGTAIKVYIHGTDMISGTETMPISNMKVDGTPMTTTPQIIANNIEPGASSSHNIFLDCPAVIPAGTYQGTVIFEITT